MPGFSNGSMYGARGESLQFSQQRRRNNVIQKIELLKNKIKTNGLSDSLHVAAMLGYLSTRLSERKLFSNDDATVYERAEFLESLIDLEIQGNIAGQKEKLSDENIKCFKGLRSQRLYDILIERRNDLMANMEMKQLPQFT